MHMHRPKTRNARGARASFEAGERADPDVWHAAQTAAVANPTVCVGGGGGGMGVEDGDTDIIYRCIDVNISHVHAHT